MEERTAGVNHLPGGQGRRPRILVLSFSPIHRDPRVLRQIGLLAELGDVVSCGYGAAPEGVVEHIHIPEDLKPWRQDFKAVALMLGLRRHRRLYFESPRVKLVRERIPPGSIDVVVANDAIAIPLALELCPRLGVHADLHEFAPRQGEDKLQWRLLVGPLMDWACRSLTRVQSVSTVAPGIAEAYARTYGITRPAVVPNATAYRRDIEPTPANQPLRLVHTGVAGRARRIEVMIDAVALANVESPGSATLDLVLVPGDERYISELTDKAATVPGNAVRLLPPVSFAEIVPMLRGYDIGIFLCPPSTFNLRHALPNKLFEFIQARLAVLIGPSPEMETIVRNHGVGWVAKDFTAQSAAEILSRITTSEIEQKKAAAHARARELSSESLSRPWLDAVRTLLEG